LCIPGGKLQQFPLPYLVKLLAAAYQYKDVGQAEDLKTANSDVRRSRGVEDIAPGGNEIPEGKF
jgi:hypothetical protein